MLRSSRATLTPLLRTMDAVSETFVLEGALPDRGQRSTRTHAYRSRRCQQSIMFSHAHSNSMSI